LTANDEAEEEPLEIPYRELSATALQGVVEAFVLREGTDYGVYEFALAEKVAHVVAQLERGEARVMFDPKSGSIGIVRPDKGARQP
jgi:uncharacterized protein